MFILYMPSMLRSPGVCYNAENGCWLAKKTKPFFFLKLAFFCEAKCSNFYARIPVMSCVHL